MSTRKQELSSAAYSVADEYRDGRLPHLACREWRDTWRKLAGEVERRCPGFAQHEYLQALEEGFRDSR